MLPLVITSRGPYQSSLHCNAFIHPAHVFHKKHLEHSTLSNTKGVSCSGIGIIISFRSLTTSPAIKLHDKHLTILSNRWVKCSSTKRFSVINLSNSFSKSLNASWSYFFRRSLSRICFDKIANSFERLTLLSFIDVVNVLWQTFTTDISWLSLSKVEGIKRWHIVSTRDWIITKM